MRDARHESPPPRITPDGNRGPVRLRTVLRALRPHQWVKNALVLVPAMAAHVAASPRVLGAELLALIAFCACASSVYIVNDLLDLEADRTHPRKSKRPFAAGDLPISAGLVLAPLLLVSAALISMPLPARFQLSLAAYYLLTLAYSFALKGRALIDVITLASFYTLRIVAGALAVRVALSFWMLLFSMFLFLSLALVKRFVELDYLRRQGQLDAIGRGYQVDDLPLLQSLGVASGYLSVLVLALYINSPAIEALYSRPKLVWMLSVLMLYWISRVWMLAQRGVMHEDPVVFAITDRPSLLVGALALATLIAAI